MTEPELRIVQLVNLQEQLAAFGQELYGLELESFEQVKVLKRWAPIHEAALVQPHVQQADAATALERYLDQDICRPREGRGSTKPASGVRAASEQGLTSSRWTGDITLRYVIWRRN